jgi:hypothetical protein
VVTPGANDIDWLLSHVGLPGDLTGRTVLDIGTTNGAGAFVAERRGAGRVVTVDIFPPDYYGFTDIAALLGSHAEYVQASVYGLAELLGERLRCRPLPRGAVPPAPPAACARRDSRSHAGPCCSRPL